MNYQNNINRLCDKIKLHPDCMYLRYEKLYGNKQYRFYLHVVKLEVQKWKVNYYLSTVNI